MSQWSLAKAQASSEEGSLETSSHCFFFCCCLLGEVEDDEQTHGRTNGFPSLVHPLFSSFSRRTLASAFVFVTPSPSAREVDARRKHRKSAREAALSKRRRRW